MNKVTLIGRKDPYCTYCENAKRYLDFHEIEYDYKEIHKDISKDALRELTPNWNGTVPAIFSGHDYIGGFTELKEAV